MTKAEPQFTKGEWRHDSHGGTFYVVTDAGNMVADGDTEEGYLARIRGVGRGASQEEMEANARVLAASKNLYFACRRILESFNGYDLVDDIPVGAIEDLRSAVAKVEG